MDLKWRGVKKKKERRRAGGELSVRRGGFGGVDGVLVIDTREKNLGVGERKKYTQRPRGQNGGPGREWQGDGVRALQNGMSYS